MSSPAQAEPGSHGRLLAAMPYLIPMVVNRSARVGVFRRPQGVEVAMVGSIMAEVSAAGVE